MAKSKVETHEVGGDAPEVTKHEVKRIELFQVRRWNGLATMEVYVCSKCGRQIDNIDDMKLHVLGHFPENQRDKLLDALTQEQ